MIDVNKAMQIVEGKIQAALKNIGAEGVSWAAEQLRENGYSPATEHPTSNLVNSLAYSTSEEASPTLKSGTEGTPLELAPKLSVRIGTNVVYAPRVEFGFAGVDSLGRVYNQPAKPFLMNSITAHKDKILKILAMAKV